MEPRSERSSFVGRRLVQYSAAQCHRQWVLREAFRGPAVTTSRSVLFSLSSNWVARPKGSRASVSQWRLAVRIRGSFRLDCWKRFQTETRANVVALKGPRQASLIAKNTGVGPPPCQENSQRNRDQIYRPEIARGFLTRSRLLPKLPSADPCRLPRMQIVLSCLNKELAHPLFSTLSTQRRRGL